MNDQISYKVGPSLYYTINEPFKSLAIMVLISLGEFERVMQMLDMSNRKDLVEILVNITQKAEDN